MYFPLQVCVWAGAQGYGLQLENLTTIMTAEPSENTTNGVEGLGISKKGIHWGRWSSRPDALPKWSVGTSVIPPKSLAGDY